MVVEWSLGSDILSSEKLSGVSDYHASHPPAPVHGLRWLSVHLLLKS